MRDYNEKISNNIKRLIDYVEKNNVPGYVKFKVINLDEKQKRGWSCSLTDSISVAKGVKDVLNDTINEERGERKNKYISTNTGKRLDDEEVKLK
jgi:hypothetical protein